MTVLEGVADLAVGEAVYLDSVQEHKTIKSSTSRTESVRLSLEHLQDHTGAWIARVKTVSPNVIFILTLEATNDTIVLVEDQRQVMEDVALKCCSDNSTADCPLLQLVSGENNTDICHIPPNFCNVNGELEVLDLTQFNMECELPTELAQLTSLKVMDLPPLTSGSTTTLGKIVSALDKLERLKIQDSNIQGNLTCDLANKNLKLLDLTRNKLSGIIPECILNMPNLEFVDLIQNNLSGSLPQINSGSKLRQVLMGNQSVGLIGQIPSMVNATQLELLYLNHNQFQGTLPNFAKAIRQINLMNNNIHGWIPYGYRSLQNLEAFEVRNNNLTGDLHDFLATIPALQVLDITNNSIKGTIPTEWDAPNLKQVQLGSNKLFGSLPSALGALQQAVVIAVDNNGLSGNLNAYAVAIVDDNYVLDFDVSNNNFNGQIPHELSKLALFQNDLVLIPGPNKFILENNHFQGQIPKQIMEAMLIQKDLLVKVQGNFFDCPAYIPPELRSEQLDTLECHDVEANTMVVVADLPSHSPEQTEVVIEPEASEDGDGESSVAGIVMLIIFMVFGIVLLSVISFFIYRMYRKRQLQYYQLQQNNSLQYKPSVEGSSLDSRSNPPEINKQVQMQEQIKNINNSLYWNGKTH